MLDSNAPRHIAADRCELLTPTRGIVGPRPAGSGQGGARDVIRPVPGLGGRRYDVPRSADAGPGAACPQASRPAPRRTPARG
ncbi:hypothetical protein NOCARDAX2BIS_430042 [Nocardioides sp. AX2bis]|nr:hypothetical protein NOCARDAX2BIS_430042 [Nocardioides sp. AX2bis]